jgi:hypothetical protein
MNQHVGVDELKIVDRAFDIDNLRRVIVRLPVVCKPRNRDKKNAQD